MDDEEKYIYGRFLDATIEQEAYTSFLCQIRNDVTWWQYAFLVPICKRAIVECGKTFTVPEAVMVLIKWRLSKCADTLDDEMSYFNGQDVQTRLEIRKLIEKLVADGSNVEAGQWQELQASMHRPKALYSHPFLPPHDPTTPFHERMLNFEIDPPVISTYGLKNEFIVFLPDKMEVQMRNVRDSRRSYVSLDVEADQICTSEMKVPQFALTYEVPFVFSIGKSTLSKCGMTKIWESKQHYYVNGLREPAYEAYDSDWIINRSEIDWFYKNWTSHRKLVAVPNYVVKALTKISDASDKLEVCRTMSSMLEYMAQGYAREMITFVFYSRGIDDQDISSTFIDEELIAQITKFINQTNETGKQPLIIIEGRPSIGKTFFGFSLQEIMNKMSGPDIERVVYMTEPSFPLYSSMYDANFRSRFIEELRYLQLNLAFDSENPIFVERYTLTIPWLLTDARADKGAISTMNMEKAREFLRLKNFKAMILFLVDERDNWDDTNVEERSKREWTNKVVQNGKIWLRENQNDIPFRVVGVI